jgi:hypothetical protein
VRDKLATSKIALKTAAALFMNEAAKAGDAAARPAPVTSRMRVDLV